ncbi:MAG TPA: sulfotransferase [Syntrophorhabdaceae bacterium]|jgi:hypothetical protein
MIVNICCSGSSGSTFFSNLLNRHPDIVCGEEMGLFSKPILYDDFDRLKRWSFIIRRVGVPSNPYFEDRSLLRNPESFSLTRSRIWEMLVTSEDGPAFVQKLKVHIFSLTGKKIWGEKTPENIYAIDRFLRAFVDSKVIHIVRDPRDTILSLMRRGLTVERAAEVWLTSVAAIWKHRQDPRVQEIRYEDLVLETESTLRQVCGHLGVEFDMRLFLDSGGESRGITRAEGLDTWASKPSEGISANSIGKYDKSGVVLLDRVYSMTLTEGFAALLGAPRFTLARLASEYGYILDDSRHKCLGGRVKPQKRKLHLALLDAMLGIPRPATRVVY